jgi:GxxExxY protein
MQEEPEDNLDLEPEPDPVPHRAKPRDFDPLTYAVIGAAQKVHRTLGPGFSEGTYQAALGKELMLRAIPFESQAEYEVYYEGMLCGRYKPDLVVSGRLVVELKAVVAVAKEHAAKTISYLKASGLPVALLLNFGALSLQVRRFKNTK